MSDKTIFNQDLTLNSLTINNATDSNASGYVPKSTTVSGNGVVTEAVYLTGPTVVGSPSIQAAGSDIYLITQTGGGVVLETPTAEVTLSCPAQNVLQVQEVNTNTLLLGSAGSQVTLTAPAQNQLSFFGQLDCNTINIATGGNITTPAVSATNLTVNQTLTTTNITNVYFGVSQNNNISVPANGTANLNITGIPFVSIDSTSAIASLNATGSYSSGVFISNVEITAGATTNLSIQLVNTTGVAITAYNVSYILFNGNGFGGL
jgi:hypothetical protein